MATRYKMWHGVTTLPHATLQKNRGKWDIILEF